ncbi:hypothetical protein [Sphingobium sp. YR768]|uniref:hypothetical protein n=1 Tax=Sphingobium sp. YR768 TaxID=1884365 RepID=UPI0008C440BD|nr:hypothetical protein [Sphingobium sp. YR768]SES08840.1 hypothetical protein SAMN05518866_13755 [Sphingobium sp. YR768]
MASEYIEQLGAVVGLGGGAGGGFFAIKWFAEWIAGRLDKREARLDDTAAKLISALEKRIETLTERLDAVEKMLADCQRMHSKAEAEVLKLRAVVEGKGIIDQKAQAIVAADRLAQMGGE